MASKSPTNSTKARYSKRQCNLYKQRPGSSQSSKALFQNIVFFCQFELGMRLTVVGLVQFMLQLFYLVLQVLKASARCLDLGSIQSCLPLPARFALSHFNSCQSMSECVEVCVCMCVYMCILHLSLSLAVVFLFLTLSGPFCFLSQFEKVSLNLQ